MSELKDFTMKSIQRYQDGGEVGSSRFALQREERVMASSPSLVLARTGWHYLPSFGTDGAAWKKIVLLEMAKKDWSSKQFDKKINWEVVPQLCNQRRLQGRLKQYLSDAYSPRKRAA